MPAIAFVILMYSVSNPDPSFTGISASRINVAAVLLKPSVETSKKRWFYAEEQQILKLCSNFTETFAYPFKLYTGDTASAWKDSTVKGGPPKPLK